MIFDFDPYPYVACGIAPRFHLFNDKRLQRNMSTYSEPPEGLTRARKSTGRSAIPVTPEGHTVLAVSVISTVLAGSVLAVISILAGSGLAVISILAGSIPAVSISAVASIVPPVSGSVATAVSAGSVARAVGKVAVLHAGVGPRA